MRRVCLDVDKIIAACKAASDLNLGTDGLQIPLASVMHLVGEIERLRDGKEGCSDNPHGHQEV
jgi:hypothetical protein